MRIGENSYINGTSMVIEKPPYEIIIGNNVSIGHWCYLSVKMHKTDNPQERFFGNITIEDNVWIGNSVVIYPGVTIGHDSVIGANTVITRDVKPFSKIKNTQEVIEQ